MAQYKVRYTRDCTYVVDIPDDVVDGEEAAYRAVEEQWNIDLKGDGWDGMLGEYVTIDGPGQFEQYDLKLNEDGEIIDFP